MDIVLLKDVERLGAEGSVVTVKPGYARNYLIPNGLAVPATAQYLNALEEANKRRDRKTARIQEEALTLKRKLEGHSWTLTLTLGEGSKPFGSITTHDIVEALATEHVTIDKHAIRLEQPIKSLGFYEVPVRLHPEVTATLKLVVAKAATPPA